MKVGNIKIKDLSEKQKTELLCDVVGMCLDEVGDSYSEFGRRLTKHLKHLELVDYGE